MRVVMLIAVLGGLTLAGCGDIGSSQRRGPVTPPGIDIPKAGQPAPQAAGTPAPTPGAAASSPAPAVPVAQPQPQMPGQPAMPAPGTERVEAGVGVGAKGHYGSGVVMTPLDVYWRAQERITFNVQIEKAMQMYKAEHDNKGPATHEEFMQKIVKEGMINLPRLPDGHRYLYDPKTEKLMVERPGAQ